MKLATVRTGGGTRAARIEGAEAVLLDAADVGEVLAADDWRIRAEKVNRTRIGFDPADLAPVIVNPRKIICLGLNYKSHIEEMGREPAEFPTIFGKFAVSLIGARDPIILPKESKQVDWEVELGIIIGRRVRRARGSDVEGAIAGMTVINDISMRDWQMRTLQFLQGKTWDRSTPVGPWVVTLDETGGANADLELTCSVGNEVMQKQRTSDMQFKPTEIVEYLSTIMTLEPGDIIATGTPAGVGIGRTPPVFLKKGSVVTTTIENVGELVNTCVAE